MQAERGLRIKAEADVHDARRIARDQEATIESLRGDQELKKAEAEKVLLVQGELSTTKMDLEETLKSVQVSSGSAFSQEKLTVVYIESCFQHVLFLNNIGAKASSY